MRVRRRRVCFIRIGDELVPDLGKFFRGEIALTREIVAVLLCPISGTAHALGSEELALLARLRGDDFVDSQDLIAQGLTDEATLADLVARGIVVAENDVGAPFAVGAEEMRLVRMGWHDLAAVYQAHSRWQGVRGEDAHQPHGLDAMRARLEARSAERGPPPPHWTRRTDAGPRIALASPPLEGPFFDALRARRTTRAFVQARALPLSALETMMYAVFAAHGIKQLATGITAIKRTSASGGGLHPTEAYVLAIKVDGLPTGLYHYEIGTHALAPLKTYTEAHARELATRFVAGQAYFAEAHALVLHVVRMDRHFWKYSGHHKAYKAVLMDSAHLSQTFYLTAAHLGLGAFYTAAINDADIAEELGLDALAQAPVGISGLGIADTARNDLHFLPDVFMPEALTPIAK
jgi:putative peptide maturation dehydrogenase